MAVTTVASVPKPTSRLLAVTDGVNVTILAVSSLILARLGAVGVLIWPVCERRHRNAERQQAHE